jgi:hypothetical protein
MKNKQERKKVIETGIFFIVIIITFLILSGLINRTYSREAQVESVTDKEIMFTDYTNNQWIWIKEDNEKEYTKGEKVTLTFDRNNTIDIVEDDIITDVKRK